MVVNGGKNLFTSKYIIDTNGFANYLKSAQSVLGAMLLFIMDFDVFLVDKLAYLES